MRNTIIKVKFFFQILSYIKSSIFNLNVLNMTKDNGREHKRFNRFHFI